MKNPTQKNRIRREEMSAKRLEFRWRIQLREEAGAKVGAEMVDIRLMTRMHLNRMGRDHDIPAQLRSARKDNVRLPNGLRLSKNLNHREISDCQPDMPLALSRNGKRSNNPVKSEPNV
jgi:hypothetical protein